MNIIWIGSIVDFVMKSLKKYENNADINNEIINNSKFRDEINIYLNNNPTIRYKQFKQKENKFYYTNECNFDINSKTFKNFYHKWKKNSLVNKYYLFENNKIK